jgi:hypothetical protein
MQMNGFFLLVHPFPSRDFCAYIYTRTGSDPRASSSVLTSQVGKGDSECLHTDSTSIIIIVSYAPTACGESAAER